MTKINADDILMGLVELPIKKHCECGGTLVNDFPGAYMCDTCKYYESKGRIVTRCDGSSTVEFTIEEHVLYEGIPYKVVRRDADVGELVLLLADNIERRIYRVADYCGVYKRSIELENGEVVEYQTDYRVLVPLCEVSK